MECNYDLLFLCLQSGTFKSYLLMAARCDIVRAGYEKK